MGVRGEHIKSLEARTPVNWNDVLSREHKVEMAKLHQICTKSGWLRTPPCDVVLPQTRSSWTLFTGRCVSSTTQVNLELHLKGRQPAGTEHAALRSIHAGFTAPYLAYHYRLTHLAYHNRPPDRSSVCAGRRMT